MMLAGGASRRMGQDKASISIHGVAMGQRIVNALSEAGLPVTVLGGPRLIGASYIEDARPLSGPLGALSGFVPTAEWVFVCSCDLPLFDPEVLGLLASEIEDHDGAVPVIAGRAQPLCALYTGSAIQTARLVFESGRSSVMAWLDRLVWVGVNEAQFEIHRISPWSACGVNTQEELKDALRRTGLQ